MRSRSGEDCPAPVPWLSRPPAAAEVAASEPAVATAAAVPVAVDGDSKDASKLSSRPGADKSDAGNWSKEAKLLHPSGPGSSPTPATAPAPAPAPDDAAVHDCPAPGGASNVDPLRSEGGGGRTIPPPAVDPVCGAPFREASLRAATELGLSCGVAAAAGLRAAVPWSKQGTPASEVQRGV